MERDVTSSTPGSGGEGLFERARYQGFNFLGGDAFVIGADAERREDDVGHQVDRDFE